MPEQEKDLDLKEIGHFTGTQGYTNVLGLNATDGIVYIMKAGYSWFVTDMAIIIKSKFKDEEFLCVKLEVDTQKNTAKAIIDDGNGNVLYTQDYKYTDAKRDLKLFCTDNVIMLNSEY